MRLLVIESNRGAFDDQDQCDELSPNEGVVTQRGGVRERIVTRTK